MQQQDPIFTDRMIVGGMMLVFGVAAANTLSPKFAATFALLIFVAAFLAYGPALMTAIGFEVGSTGTTQTGNTTGTTN
ncbi:MAG: hypothetical protein ACRDUW_03425 [Pseudonocardiaceae bacterium]